MKNKLGEQYRGAYAVGQYKYSEKWYVRPRNWAGMWEDGRLLDHCGVWEEFEDEYTANSFAQGAADFDIFLDKLRLVENIANDKEGRAYIEGFLRAQLDEYPRNNEAFITMLEDIARQMKKLYIAKVERHEPDDEDRP